VAATEPTILATSGGFRPGIGSRLAFAPMVGQAIELAGVSGRAPRLVHLGTANGDQRWLNAVNGVHRLVGEGVLPRTYCSDDGVGLLYRGQDFAAAFSEVAGKAAYVVDIDSTGTVSEERIEPELLSG